MKQYLLLENESGADNTPEVEKLSYLSNAGCCDKVAFGWVYQVLQFGNKEGQSIAQQNLEDLSMEERSEAVFNKWQSNWNYEKQVNSKNPLGKSLRQTFTRRFLVAAISDFLAYQMTIITPIIVYFIAKFLQDESHPIGWAIFWLCLTPIVRFLRSFFDAHGSYQMAVLGSDIANCISLGMVKKALNYSVLCNKKFKMGEISSLMQVDCFRMQLFPKNFAAIIFISYVLVFGMVFMSLLVGVSFLAGMGVLVIASMINLFISRFTAGYAKQIANGTDDRMKVTSEVFNNVKFIKVNAWEEYFYDKLMSKRNNQLKWYQKKFFVECFSQYSMWITPKYILAATFGAYVLLAGGTLSPPVAFSIMMLYSYIQFYLQFLPASLSITIESLNAINRIQNFLLAEEINRSCITYNKYELSYNDFNAIQVENGNFYWDKDTEQKTVASQDVLNLVDLNFKIKKGEIVAIIGGIGTGKSSLMYSLLGQMKYKEHLQKPRVVINGTMSLVTQKPWIVNDTVKNNILFGKPYDKQKYIECVHYACLKRDFELFTDGDQTMIGEKGATLSGGQKARISFARSLYSESDILLLDDLLSAVDVHVGKTLMTESLLQYAGKKTRILITHALHYLRYVDKVLIMEDGKIVEQGTYEYIKTTSRFQQTYNAMMKQGDNEKPKKDEINLLEIGAAEQEGVPAQQLIDAQIERQASIHTKKSRTHTAIDREKLEKMRAARVTKQLSRKQGKQKDVQLARMMQQPKKPQKKKQQKKQKADLMMAEEVSNEGVGLKLYLSFARYNRGYCYVSIIILVKFCWMLLNALSNVWIARWTENSTAPPQDQKHDNEFYFEWYLLIGFLYGTAAFIRALFIAFATPRMSATIHQSMISNLLFAPLTQFFDRVPLGRIFNRLSKDLNSVDSNLPSLFNNTLVFIFFLLTNTTVICVVAPVYIFLPVIFVYVCCCGLLKRFYSKPSKQLTSLEAISKSPIVSCFSEILSGVSTIRSYEVQDKFFLKNCEKINDNKKPIIARKGAQVWFTIRLTLLSWMVNIAALVYVLFFSYKNQQGYQAAADGALLLVSTLGFDEIMYFLLSNLGNFESQLVSLERCETFMDIEPQRGYIQYMKNRDQLKIASKERRKNKTGWPQKGRIQFTDLKCRYRPDLDLVLRGLTVTFEGGHKIGVVGRTGSGKSTIMMCLLRILEAAGGKIVVDGKDISTLSLDDLRSKMTIILQDPCLFAGTIRENLDPLQEYDDAQLLKCLDLCALRQTMQSRKGLETQITQNGQNLSVGQRQLVSICRSILKPTRIVLVDEATANIDVKTESIIYKAMNEGFKHSTVITVAHRLNTVINSDRILVLEGGTLKEFDNPQELLKDPNSFFAQLYNESQKESQM